MRINYFQKTNVLLLAVVIFGFQYPTQFWESKFIKLNKDGSLAYTPGEKGNMIPDFSRVGYYASDKTYGMCR